MHPGAPGQAPHPQPCAPLCSAAAGTAGPGALSGLPLAAGGNARCPRAAWQGSSRRRPLPSKLGERGFSWSTGAGAVACPVKLTGADRAKARLPEAVALLAAAALFPCARWAALRELACLQCIPATSNYPPDQPACLSAAPRRAAGAQLAVERSTARDTAAGRSRRLFKGSQAAGDPPVWNMTSPAGPQASSQPAAGSADKAKPAAGSPQQEGPAGSKPSPAAAAAAGAQREGSPSRQQQQQQQQQQQSSPNGKAAEGGAASAGEAARRLKRREAWEREQEAQRRWDLQRRLADISTDVEFLAREVRVCMQQGLLSCCFCCPACGAGPSDGCSRLSSAVRPMARGPSRCASAQLPPRSPDHPPARCHAMHLLTAANLQVERVRAELEVPLPPLSELPEAERVRHG